MSLFTFPYADTINEPLVDAWWIPGFTSQAPSYIYASNPLLANGPGFPSGLDFVAINGSYFDTSGNPLSGYLTFWPSSPLTFDINGHFTYMPQRYAGLNFSLIGVNQMGDGKIYLQYGRLYVSVLATNNINMAPSAFTYHVRENFVGGNQYDITAPIADDTQIQDIRSLIIPGTIRPITDEDDDFTECWTSIPVTATQYLTTNVTNYSTSGVPQNLTSYPVSFAFETGNDVPGNSDWQPASWAPTTSSNIAQILIGSGAGGYPLAVGVYRVWVQVITNTQTAVIPVGFLNIYQVI